VAEIQTPSQGIRGDGRSTFIFRDGASRPTKLISQIPRAPRRGRHLDVEEGGFSLVWEPTKVRNLLDSLYQGYPVGYLISWRNPSVKLKDGTTSAGKRILIDGQQRVTALMAGLLGREVLTKDYETARIRIAFHPQNEKFEVANPAIRKDVGWLEDVAEVFAPEADLLELTESYARKNPDADKRAIGKVLQKLCKIVNNHVGLIELAEDLDIRDGDGDLRPSELCWSRALASRLRHVQDRRE
jgi:hypothetical protein